MFLWTPTLCNLGFYKLWKYAIYFQVILGKYICGYCTKFFPMVKNWICMLLIKVTPINGLHQCACARNGRQSMKQILASHSLRIWMKGALESHLLDATNLEDMDRLLLCCTPSQRATYYTKMKALRNHFQVIDSISMIQHPL